MPTRSAPGRHAAPRHRSRKAGAPASRRLRYLLPSPAVIGAAALVVAGGGAYAAPNGFDHAEEPTSQVASSSARSEASQTYLQRRNLVQVSRTIDREVLERQAKQQAEQRSQALAAQAKNSKQRANKLEEAKQKRIERRERRKARQWVLPVAGYHLTAGFGQSSSMWSTTHTGLDFAAASGTEIVSVAKGTVTEIGNDGAYGNKTVVTLENGTEVWYCHQSSTQVSQGQQVDPGETIGSVGSTGNTTGPHLHLEIRPSGGEPVNPSKVLRDHNVSP